MLDFFTSFFEACISIWRLIFQFICDIPGFLKTYWDIVGLIPDYLFFLPPGLLEAIGLMLVFAILYKILGREG